jgi:hypothetical protein
VVAGFHGYSVIVKLMFPVEFTPKPTYRKLAASKHVLLIL